MATTVNKTVEQIVYEGIDKITAVSKQGADSVKQMRQALDGVKSVLGALGVTVGAGALVAIHYQSLQATAALNDMAQQAGASVEGLSAIQRVAKVGGHDMEGFTGQIGKMIRGLKDGSEEGGKSARALASIGISALAANGRIRDTSEIVFELADKLKGFADDGDKVRFVQDALGKGAERYIPLLKDMADGTDRHASVTREQAARAEEAAKNIRRLHLAMEDARRETVNEFTPGIIRFTNELLAAQRAVGGFWSGLALFMTVSGEQGENPGAALDKINEKLARLRQLRSELDPGKSFANRVNDVVFGDVGDLDRQIALLDKQQRILTDLHTRRLRGLTAGLVQDPSGEILPAPATPSLNYRPPDEGEGRERDFVARQLQEGLEEEQRIQAEAAAFTAKFREQERENLRRFRALDLQETDDFYQVGGTQLLAFYDERNRIINEAEDREQELEIERGQASIDADGLGHAMKLEALRQDLLTQEELQNEAHAKRLENLAKFSDAELEALGGKHAVIERMEQEHQERVNALSNKGNQKIFNFIDDARKGDLQGATGHFAALTAGFAQHSRKMFELNKIAALADATVSMAQGISKSLAAYPWPWNLVAVAAHTALFTVQLQAIRSAQFGGGAPAPSVVGGGTPATPVTPVETGAPTATARQQTTIVQFSGTQTDRDLIRRFVSLLNENTADGGRIILQ